MRFLLLLFSFALSQKCPAEVPPNSSRKRCGNIFVGENDCLKMNCCWTNDFLGINCFENPLPATTATNPTTKSATDEKTTSVQETKTTTTTLETTITLESATTTKSMERTIFIPTPQITTKLTSKSTSDASSDGALTKAGIIVGSIAGAIFALGLTSFLYYSISNKRNNNNQNALLSLEKDDHTHLKLHDEWIRQGSLQSRGSPAVGSSTGMASGPPSLTPVYRESVGNYENYSQYQGSQYHGNNMYHNYQANNVYQDDVQGSYYDPGEYAQYAPQNYPNPQYPPKSA